jgi:hypothetical protein
MEAHDCATSSFSVSRFGLDSTTIQVVMDILGVLLTVQVCSWILDTVFADWEQ